MPSHPETQLNTPPHQRARAIFSAVAWSISITWFLLHVAHSSGFGSPLWTMLGVVWFGAVGYLGAPIYAVSLHTGRLSTRACLHGAWALFGVSGVLSILFALHDLTPDPTNPTLALVVPLALGAQAYKTAAAHAERERAVTDALTEYDVEHHANPCPACNLRAQIDELHERLRKHVSLDGLGEAEKNDVIDAVAQALTAGSGAALHVIDGRSSVRHTH